MIKMVFDENTKNVLVVNEEEYRYLLKQLLPQFYTQSPRIQEDHLERVKMDTGLARWFDPYNSAGIIYPTIEECERTLKMRKISEQVEKILDN